MEGKGIPFPPRPVTSKHATVINHAQLKWFRKTWIVLTATISAVVIYSCQNIDIQVELDQEELLSNVSLILHDMQMHYAQWSQVVPDILVQTKALESDANKSGKKLTAIATSTSESAGSVSASLAIDRLIQKQLANIYTSIGEMKQGIYDTLAELQIQTPKITDIAATIDVMNSKIGAIDATLTALEAKAGARNELLTNILEAVTYEEERFRSKVRKALIGSTMIGTQSLEAGGQCDVIPEECTLVGETETVIEDVTFL